MSSDRRVGFGSDLHRLEKGRRLVLGGVEIESERGAAGHSDADALLHALIDALFGAAGLGDIGEHYPDTDPAWAGADSGDLLADAISKVRAAGFAVVNADLTVALEAPKLGPRKADIRRNVAALLGIAEARVNVKAKTGEGLGPVGRGEAVEARAVVLLEES